MRRIRKPVTCRHVYGIGRGPIVSAVLGGAVEIERGAALPFVHNAFAEFVFVNLRLDGGLRDFRKCKAVGTY
jgi:hypothetical protein